ncbi:MAG: hypothetical protein IPP94_04750 [Ignavibacteria bacterium]|nr:hypothetical protein [Ignavibacteria bacterium]
MNTIGCIPRVSVVVFGLLLLLPVVAVAQPVVLSGVINVSTPVASIDTSCNQQLEVMSSAGFFPGLKAVIMQMKGANISLIEGFSFGTIIDLNPAGQYEIVTIQGVVGNTIQLKYSLLNSYDPKKNVQLVSLPSYPSASISGLVSAKPWDGSSGGVIAMDVADTLFLSGTIDASGAGFRGGRTSVNKPTYTMHEYAFAWSTAKGGAKGEGIANVGTNYEAGRGPLANGGGGGNAVNTGGGGGANLARGGRGGKQYIGSGADEVMGIGGYSVPYSIALQRVFLGGGGGGPHQNDGTSTPGVNGGGIILIRAKSIVATPSGRIRSNGSDAATAGNDGAGGGGAGGTILLSAQDMTALSAEVKGGKGGDVTNTNTLNHCHGPGGGGGGGIVWVSASAVPPSLSVNASRGEAGLIVSMNTPCRNTTWGAEPGVAGGTLAGLAIKESAIGASAIRVTTSSAVMLCKDSCTTLSAHASGGTGPYTYQWSPPVGLSNPNDSVTRACPQGATTYLVSITDAHGCSASATVAVSILPGPLVTAGPPAIICKDSCVTLSAHAINSPGPFTYRWSPPTGLSNPTDSVTRACPQATTTYTVTVTDARGCQTAASVTITVLSAPGVSIMRSGDTLICSLAAQYQWYYEGVAIPGATLWRIKIGLPGRYSVRITDALGCVAVAEYIVTAPLKVLTNAPAAICLDSCATLVARTVGGTPPLRFSWIPNTDLSNPSDSVTRACPKVTTVYSVLVTDSLGTQMIGSVTVTVSQAAAPTITRSGDTLICSPASQYQWYLAGAPIPGETRQKLRIGPAANTRCASPTAWDVWHGRILWSGCRSWY